MVIVTVKNRVLRGGRLQQAGDPLLLELLQQEITVADLIRRTVEEQVREVNVARRLQMIDGSTTAEADSASGEVDVRLEVQKAQQAFSRGDYLILINSNPAIRLDDSLTFTPGAQIHFVRLMPLVGG